MLRGELRRVREQKREGPRRGISTEPLVIADQKEEKFFFRSASTHAHRSHHDTSIVGVELFDELVLGHGLKSSSLFTTLGD